MYPFLVFLLTVVSVNMYAYSPVRVGFNGKKAAAIMRGSSGAYHSLVESLQRSRSCYNNRIIRTYSFSPRTVTNRLETALEQAKRQHRLLGKKESRWTLTCNDELVPGLVDCKNAKSKCTCK